MKVQGFFQQRVNFNLYYNPGLSVCLSVSVCQLIHQFLSTHFFPTPVYHCISLVETHHLWIVGLLCAIFLLSIPLWVYLASNNPVTKSTLSTGWSPVIAAMVISSGGGLILDHAVSRFPGIAVYSPVMNGKPVIHTIIN